MYTKLTYFDTLYKREATMIICGDIDFVTNPGMITFKSMGRGYAISVENVISISPAY